MVSSTSFERVPPVTPTYAMRLERRSRHDDLDSTSMHSSVSRYKAGAVAATIELMDGIIVREFSQCGSIVSMARTVVRRTQISLSAESAVVNRPTIWGVIGTRCALHESSQIIRLRRMGSLVRCRG